MRRSPVCIATVVESRLQPVTDIDIAAQTPVLSTGPAFRNTSEGLL
jgi:hypothetical protein